MILIHLQINGLEALELFIKDQSYSFSLILGAGFGMIFISRLSVWSFRISAVDLERQWVLFVRMEISSPVIGSFSSQIYLTFASIWLYIVNIYMHKVKFKDIFMCLGLFVETAFHNLWPDLIQSPVLTLNDFIALKSAFWHEFCDCILYSALLEIKQHWHGIEKSTAAFDSIFWDTIFWWDLAGVVACGQSVGNTRENSEKYFWSILEKYFSSIGCRQSTRNGAKP